MHAGGGGGERDGVRAADVGGELLFEVGGARARGDPAGAQDIHDGCDIGIGHGRL